MDLSTVRCFLHWIWGFKLQDYLCHFLTAEGLVVPKLLMFMLNTNITLGRLTFWHRWDTGWLIPSEWCASEWCPLADNIPSSCRNSMLVELNLSCVNHCSPYIYSPLPMFFGSFLCIITHLYCDFKLSPKTPPWFPEPKCDLLLLWKTWKINKWLCCQLIT